jgi:hypothetical protein
MSSSDPIHDVHVWLPDYNGQHFAGQVWHPGANFSPFHPLFLQRLAPFHTLRFMQDQETITSQVRHWSDRRPWDYETQMTDSSTFQNGIAPEYVVELCNELKADAWVNVPHLAQDDWMTGMAQLLHNNLNPGLKVDLEWSNEVWNGAPGFMPYRWIQQQLALPQNAGVNFFQFVAQKEQHAFSVFSQQFANHPGQLVRVVAGFEENPGYTSRLLQAMNGQFDAVSVAAYFGPDATMRARYGPNTTVDQIVADTAASIPEYLRFLGDAKSLADQYSRALGRPISLLAYEGGPNLTGSNQPYQAAMNAASIDPRTYGIYRTFLQGANGVGLGLLVNFQYTDRYVPNSPYGIFGSAGR